MDINKMLSKLEVPTFDTPTIKDPMAPSREIDLSTEDELIVHESIEALDESYTDKEKLFNMFNDWQSKRTLTTKRVFMSTSLIVAAATWINIDYLDLSFFGLKVANGNPTKFIIFVLLTIILSGIFYELSRRIDQSVRFAKIRSISSDMKMLKEPVAKLDKVIKQNEISSFNNLYYDFKGSSLTGKVNQIDARDVYNAVKFYQSNLEKANSGQDLLSLTESLLIYSIALYSVIALIWAIIPA